MRIQIVSDIHISTKRKKEVNGIPVNFYLFYREILKIINKDKPDIIIFNGDLIENPIKLELVVINFIVFILSEIKKIQPNIRVILNTGNHDIIYTDNSINFGNFINIFSNTKNVTTVSQPRTFKLSNQLQLHILPYSNQDILSKFMENQNFQQGYNLFIMHHNFDFIHNDLYNNIVNYPNTIINYGVFKDQIDFGQYHIFNGHYHKHLEYPNKNFTVVGSIFQQSYSEKIMSIYDYGKYYGYELIDFNNIDDVKFTFVPYENGVCQIHYKGSEQFIKEFNVLKQHIIQNQKTVFYQIKIEDSNEKREEIENRMKMLRQLSNVMECRYIGTVNADFGGHIVEQNEAELSNFNLNTFYREQITQIFSETELKDRIISAFEEITSQ